MSLPAGAAPGAPVAQPSSRVSTGTVLAAIACILAVFGAGFLRTRDAAERLTRASSRPHPVSQAEVQQVLDVARFTVAAPGLPPPAPPPGPANLVTSAASADVLPSTPPVADRQAPRSSAPSPLPVPAVAAHPDTATASTVAAAPASAPVASASADAPTVVTQSGEPAAAATPAPSAAATPPPAPLRDGQFTGWGYCRHGEIQATIIVEHGRITAAEITQCLTRYSCDWIAKLPPQVVSRQSAEVDYVSGATESADAFYYAIEDALKKAR